MKMGPILMFLLAALFAASATKTVFLPAGGANRPAGAENLVGYAVGAYLPSVLLLGTGLYLLHKSRT